MVLLVLYSICQQIWKTQQWPQDWKRSVFILVLKKGNAKECSNYCTIALISHASKVMLKILQARLQQYMNHELPDVQPGFRKGRGTRDQIANIHCIIEKVWELQKNTYFWFIDYAKAFDCVDHNKLWKILQETGIPEHLTCLLKNLYAGHDKGVSRIFSNTTAQKHQFFALSLLCGPTLTSIHDDWKNHSSDYTDFVSKVVFAF